MGDYLGFSKIEITTIIAAILLGIGMFMPLISATILASTISVSLFSGGISLFAVAILLLILISFYVAWKNWPKGLHITGSAILILLLIMILRIHSGFAPLRELAGSNPYAAIALSTFHPDYGWLFLFGGVFLLFLTPRIVKSDMKKTDIEDNCEIEGCIGIVVISGLILGFVLIYLFLL
jgi:hypothetical protein